MSEGFNKQKETIGSIMKNQADLEKPIFFFNSENLGMHIWRKKTRKLQQILNGDKLHKSNI